MHVSDIDLRLLRVFVAVVESRGLANAQTLLNRDASTISKQLKLLEDRVEMKLCERGRSGFALTSEGHTFYRRTTELLSAISTFEQDARNLQGRLAGHIYLALIDNLVSDPNCSVVETLARYGERPDNNVTLHIDVMAPAQIERQVLEGSADLGIGIFPSHLGELHYETLYEESDCLICSSKHPLAQAQTPADAKAILAESAKVSRSFLKADDVRPMPEGSGKVTAWVTNVEAVAMLILAGSHVGFMPEHYARRWLESGEMCTVLPDIYRRHSPIEAVIRQSRDEKRPAVAALLEDLHTAMPR